MATIRDVAKLSGVSVATISRVINKNGYVTPETEIKVINAINQLNYSPNAVARGLARKKTNTIALVLPDITNPFFSELARAVEDAAKHYGYTLNLCNSDNEESKEKAYFDILKDRYVDGIIIASDTSAYRRHYLKNSKIPLVTIDQTPRNESSVIVTSKNIKGAKLAVRHLFEIGCKKIAHIYGPLEYKPSLDRLRGYEQAVKSQEWYSSSLTVQGNFKIESGIEAVKTLLERHPDIDGIFAGNDLMAIGALKGLLKMGKKVPEDVAICGFDNINLTEIMEPEITTVAQSIYGMGTLAVELLMKKIGESPVEADDNIHLHELDVTLIQRGSTQRGVKK
ncbi:LacI family DNA-binding transcriptional regulator [Paenibacillus sabinae]|uniref:Transcriptional regulator n=1 Tax=Paenibacillus sabinae T27 TaxID=1268072 RepID=X4ZZQ5_9BACL|nr:LacI family DNA-binding transcriptional regulator [Paenibacillus sabinae]AHV97653.1 transcriptional regulator [Paenibacillus sabinae T27]